MSSVNNLCVVLKIFPAQLVTIDCQLDKIKNHPNNISVWEFLVGKTEDRRPNLSISGNNPCAGVPD